MMIKMFVVEKNAINFAQITAGKITIKYDWDSVKNQMIKYYVVKF